MEMLRKIGKLFGGKPSDQITVEDKGLGNVVLKSGKHELSVSLTYPEFPDRQPLPPIVLDAPACPYCGVIQEPPPTRRKKCRDCKETIFTWTNQETRRKFLVTEKEYNHIRQEEWDAEWKRLHNLVKEGKRSSDWQGIKIAHFSQALMLFNKGRDHHSLALASRQAELQHYRSIGIEKVSILGSGDASCGECRQLDGTEFGVGEALALLPIPVHACDTWTDRNEHGGWCRCIYSPIFPTT
jgi:hypothetical protein